MNDGWRRHSAPEIGLSAGLHQVIQELRSRGATDHQQMIAGAGAGDVEQVALGVVDLFEVVMADLAEERA